MEKPLSTAPVTGRVHGAGTGARRDYYYSDSTEKRKERRAFEKKAMNEKLSIVEENAKQAARVEAREEVVAQFNAMMPAFAENMKAWLLNGGQGEFPLPTFTASNSFIAVSNNSPPPERTPIDNNAPPPERTPMDTAPRRPLTPATAPRSSPSISGMPDGGVTPLAELDAITVINRRLLNKFN
jgi:hypothetical protein